MTNVFFPEDQIKTDDLYFVCYMIERIARQLQEDSKIFQMLPVAIVA